MFDVDGDGLISYTEYLLLITFLSIPVEVGHCWFTGPRFSFTTIQRNEWMYARLLACLLVAYWQDLLQITSCLCIDLFVDTHTLCATEPLQPHAFEETVPFQ